MVDDVYDHIRRALTDMRHAAQHFDDDGFTLNRVRPLGFVVRPCAVKLSLEIKAFAVTEVHQIAKQVGRSIFPISAGSALIMEDVGFGPFGAIAVSRLRAHAAPPFASSIAASSWR